MLNYKYANNCIYIKKHNGVASHTQNLTNYKKTVNWFYMLQQKKAGVHPDIAGSKYVNGHLY